jgi:hypothetical protein
VDYSTGVGRGDDADGEVGGSQEKKMFSVSVSVSVVQRRAYGKWRKHAWAVAVGEINNKWGQLEPPRRIAVCGEREKLGRQAKQGS